MAPDCRHVGRPPGRSPRRAPARSRAARSPAVSPRRPGRGAGRSRCSSRAAGVARRPGARGCRCGWRAPRTRCGRGCSAGAGAATRSRTSASGTPGSGGLRLAQPVHGVRRRGRAARRRRAAARHRAARPRRAGRRPSPRRPADRTRRRTSRASSMTARRMLVTGAASGIGRAVAVLAATREPGVALGLVDRDADGLAAVAAEVAALGATGGDRHGRPRRRRRAGTSGGRGGRGAGRARRAGQQRRWHRPRHPARDHGRGVAARPSTSTRERPGCWPGRRTTPSRSSRGSIVVTTSISAQHPTPRAGAYSVSKAALSMLVRHLALEWGPVGVRVNAVAPGPVDTGMTFASFGDAGRPGGRERRRLRESVTPLAAARRSRGCRRGRALPRRAGCGPPHRGGGPGRRWAGHDADARQSRVARPIPARGRHERPGVEVLTYRRDPPVGHVEDAGHADGEDHLPVFVAMVVDPLREHPATGRRDGQRLALDAGPTPAGASCRGGARSRPRRRSSWSIRRSPRRSRR